MNITDRSDVSIERILESYRRRDSEWYQRSLDEAETQFKRAGLPQEEYFDWCRGYILKKAIQRSMNTDKINRQRIYSNTG